MGESEAVAKMVFKILILQGCHSLASIMEFNNSFFCQRPETINQDLHFWQKLGLFHGLELLLLHLRWRESFWVSRNALGGLVVQPRNRSMKERRQIWLVPNVGVWPKWYGLLSRIFWRSSSKSNRNWKHPRPKSAPTAFPPRFQRFWRGREWETKGAETLGLWAFPWELASFL